MRQMVSDTDKLQSQVIRERTRVEELQSAKIVVENKLASAEAEMVSLRQRIEQLESDLRLDDLTREFLPAVGQLSQESPPSELHAALIEREKKLQTLADRLEQVSAEKTLTLAEANRHRIEAERLAKRVAQLEKELARLKLTPAPAAELPTLEQQRLAQLESANDELRDSLHRSEASRGELQASYQYARERADNLTDQLRKMERQAARKSQEFETLTSSYLAAQERNRQLETELPPQSELEEDLRSQLAAAQRRTDQVRTLLAERESELEEIRKALQTAKVVKTALAERDTRIRTLEEKLEAFRASAERPVEEDPVERARALEAELVIKTRQISRLEQTVRLLQSQRS